MKSPIAPLLRIADLAQQDRSYFAYIVAAAIMLRCIWALLIPVEPSSDSLAYQVFAQNMVDHGVYGWTPEEPGAFWPVGTSAIYAFFFFVFGTSFLPIVVFQIALGAGIVLVGLRVTQRFFGNASANIAGLVLALWPSHIFYVTILASELPFTLLMLVAIDVWTNPKLSARTSGLAAGALLAAACYIRPVALLLPFVFGISMYYRHRDWRTEMLRMLIVFGVMAVTIAPWTLRNYQLFGHPVLISTNGPVTLWMGNHPGTDGSYAPVPEWAEGMDEYSVSQELGKQAQEYILSDPLGFIQRSTYKLVKQHSYETIAVTWNAEGITERIGEWAVMPLKALTQGYWLMVLGLSFVGLYFLYRDSGFMGLVLHPLVAPWLYFSAIHAVILAQDRYHFAAIPLIAALCALAVDRLASRYRSQLAYEYV
jgi:4-amino-4-deoxy-L-arabinose transferase-like glycosyltransferase